MKKLTQAMLLMMLPAYLAAEEANMTGWLSMFVVSDSPSGQKPVVSIRMSGIAYKQSAYNGFGSDGVILSHDYYNLPPSEAIVLGQGLQEWADAPDSDGVYSTGGFGLSVIGNAWNTELQPITILTIYSWSNPHPNQHHHGGIYYTLGLNDSRLLGETLEAWGQNPTSGVLFERVIQ